MQHLLNPTTLCPYCGCEMQIIGSIPDPYTLEDIDEYGCLNPECPGDVEQDETNTLETFCRKLDFLNPFSPLDEGGFDENGAFIPFPPQEEP